MSFVPLQGPATFVAGTPARTGEVEFRGGARTVRLPVAGAIPVLTRALRANDAHPTVRLLGGATLMAMALVAAGRTQPADDAAGWRAGPLSGADEDRIAALVASRRTSDSDADAERLVRALVDAVVDSVTRPPAAPSAPEPPRRRVRELAPEPASELRLALRVEAPEEALAAGALVLVPQVHDVDDPARFCDAGLLWRDADETPFAAGDRVRAAVRLREAARAWPPLEELLHRPVPDGLELDGADLTGLLGSGVAALREAGVDVLWPRSLRTELVQRAEVDRRPRPTDGPLMTGLFGPEALFAFRWRLAMRAPEGAEQPLSDAEMTALAEATTPIVRLRDNWTVVDPETLRRARRWASAEPRPIKPAAALQAALTGSLELDGEPLQVHPGATLAKVRDLVQDATSLAPLPEPPGLEATLRDYQRRGVTWLAELTGLGLGGCLADDMGLGKTISVVALHLHRLARGLACGPTLVVCPASLLGNWEAEVHRFAPGVPVRRFHGSARDLDVAAGLVLTTYGTMRRDHAALATVSWDLVVADEAQHIKNPESSTARHLRRISSTARVALTGTPVENNLTELWAILDWAVPGLLGSRAAFRKRWAAPIESGVDAAVTAEFARLVGPFLLRRRKSDPGIAPELPEKTETDHVVPLTREQAVLYQALVEESMRRIEEADEHTRRGLVLALLTGLKQICNHPAQYLHQESGRLRGRSEKLALFDELVRTLVAEDAAALVFTQYVAMGRLLARHLDDAGVPYLFLHGGTPVAERERMVARFQAGEVPVFLLSLKAGGTGLNLTRADHVIHVDRWWNPAVEDQATDRAHRIGRTRAVQVHRLITSGTIEQRVGELLTRKRELADAVLGGGERALTELADDELRALVRLDRAR